MLTEQQKRIAPVALKVKRDKTDSLPLLFLKKSDKSKRVKSKRAKERRAKKKSKRANSQPCDPGRTVARSSSRMVT